MNSFLKKILSFNFKGFGALRYLYFEKIYKKLGHCGNNVFIGTPISINNPQSCIFEDNVYVKANTTIINYTGRFIMRKNSGASNNLTVITGKHNAAIGITFRESIATRLKDEEKDVIIEEDAHLGANVTLLSGVTIGRGSLVGAGSVVTKSTPPYSIVAGNPAKVINFIFTLEEIIEHEKKLYPIEKRYTYDQFKEFQSSYK